MNPSLSHPQIYHQIQVWEDLFLKIVLFGRVKEIETPGLNRMRRLKMGNLGLPLPSSTAGSDDHRGKEQPDRAGGGDGQILKIRAEFHDAVVRDIK